MATGDDFDPTNKEQMNQFLDSTTNAEKIQETFNNTLNAGKEILGSLTDRIGKFGVSMQNIGNLTGESATKFGLLTTAMIGTRKSFESFANVDTSRLTTFSGQMEKLKEILTKPGTAASASTEIIKTFGAALVGVGKSQNEVNQAIAKGPAFLMAYAKNVFEGADNTLRLQNALVQLTAQAGDTEDLFHGFGTTFAGVGDNLSKLNTTAGQYKNILDDVHQSTGINRDVLEQWSGEILSLPGGFKNMITSMDLMGKQTNILTNTIQYAQGSGRDYKEVVKDMGEAMRKYGVDGEGALRFTANIGEVSSKFHARIEDVRSALMGSVDAFKFFALGEANASQMTESMSEAMNQLVGSLTSVGVPVQNAMEIFKSYTAQISNLNIAQEAFVSKQTGGVGGLQGGLQIEQMLRKGDIAGVQKKVEETIRKMSGPIVSLDEATKSQGAAQRYTYQRQLLQQGPLGSLAKTSAEAGDLQEALAHGKTVSSLNPKALEQNIGKGEKMEQANAYSKLTEALNSLTRTIDAADTNNLTTLQRVLGARTGEGGGVDNEGTAISAKNEEHLRGFQKGTTTKSPIDAALSNMGGMVNSLPEAFMEAVKGAKESLMGGNKESQMEAYKKVVEASATAERQISKLPKDQREIAEKTMHQMQEAVKTNIQTSAASHIGLFKAPTADSTSSGKQVGQTIPGGKGHSTTSHPLSAAGAPIPVILAGGSGITVNFTGNCPHCGKGVHYSEQATIQNASAGTQK